MLLIGLAILMLFWLRDYFLLRMSPPKKLAHRAILYSAALVLSTVVIWLLAKNSGSSNFIGFSRYPPVLFILIGLHLLAAAVSFWLRRRHLYDRAWVTALFPAPIVWFCVVRAIPASFVADDSSRLYILLGFAAIWALSMIFMLMRVRNRQMEPIDIDFVADYAGWSHFLGSSLVPVAAMTVSTF
jgi:hypothetical protein